MEEKELTTNENKEQIYVNGASSLGFPKSFAEATENSAGRKS